MKYTKGPWMIARSEKGDISIQDKEYLTIADIYRFPHDANIHIEANARLIAEAPAMLEALVSMAYQYLSCADEKVLTHDFMSAGEETLSLLESLGIATTEDGVAYRIEGGE